MSRECAGAGTRRWHADVAPVAAGAPATTRRIRSEPQRRPAERRLEGKLGTRRATAHRARVNILDRITIDPEQCGGNPCIRGMRIRVKDVLEMLGSGMSEADILAEFPYLEAEDLHAAQLCAARLTDHPVLRSA